MTDTTALADLLREIRDQQREQIAMQTQALQLQSELFELSRSNLARAERINDRAEALQIRAGRVQRIALWVLVPALLIVLAMLVWPYLRYFYYLMTA